MLQEEKHVVRDPRSIVHGVGRNSDRYSVVLGGVIPRNNPYVLGYKSSLTREPHRQVLRYAEPT